MVNYEYRSQIGFDLITHGIRAFLDFRGPSCQYIGGIEFRVHGVRLTGIDHEKYLMIAANG
jgi:hypothetical protein